jgi:hypothetical protein
MAEVLPKPYNWLFRKGGRRAGKGPTFRIIASQVGTAVIVPKATNTPIEIPVTRIFIQRLDRSTPVRYYDISSKVVQAQLAGYLSTGGYIGREFSLDAHGFKPSKQFSLLSMPAT